MRRRWVEALRGFQDPETGLFHEATHDPIHTTAHCVAALELFDARPARRLSALRNLRDARRMEDFLEGLDWAGDPWRESHKGAGLYAALVLSGEVDGEWERRYFDWLSSEVDEETGLLRRGAISDGGGGRPLFHHLAGTFHYLFNFSYVGRAWPHAGALVDTCLSLVERGEGPGGDSLGFAEVDWVYCLGRAAAERGHRFDEARAALSGFAAGYADFLGGLDLAAEPLDVHELFGALSAVAELQRWLPGRLGGEGRLRLVLDRRPFI